MRDRFYFLLAGENFSDMIESHGIDYKNEESLEDIEKEMNIGTMGFSDFDICEGDAKAALIEAGATFAVVFKGSKIYAYVSETKTATFESITSEGIL